MEVFFVYEPKLIRFTLPLLNYNIPFIVSIDSIPKNPIFVIDTQSKIITQEPHPPLQEILRKLR